MFEQMATFFAGYTAALFIFMMSAIILFGAFWIKAEVCRKKLTFS